MPNVYRMETSNLHLSQSQACVIFLYIYKSYVYMLCQLSNHTQEVLKKEAAMGKREIK